MIRRRVRPDHLAVSRLRALHDDLSRAFRRLTSISAAELNTLLLLGTIQLVCMVMLLVTSWQTGSLASGAPFAVSYACGPVIAM